MQWILMVSMLVLVGGYLVLQFFSGAMDEDESSDVADGHGADEASGQDAATDQELKAA